MKKKPFTLEELEKMSKEELTALWDKDVLSDATKDYLITKVPFLKFVRQAELKKRDEDSPKE